MRRLFPLLVLLVIAAAPVSAQTDKPAPAPDAVPPAMEPLDDSLEPQVTIREREGAKVEEYRINGRLYKIRVFPENGVPYTLIDQRGDGHFTPDGPGNPQLSVPMWVIGTF